MSIVAVHGPNTFGSKGVVGGPGPVTATVSPTNGLIWTFTLDGPTTRAEADFDWAFPGGTPATVADDSTPAAVTYAAAGSKTATLTVTGAGTGNNPYPPAGSYPITFTAVAGAGPQSGLMSAPPDEDEEEFFDPADYTVAEVEEYAEANPDQIDELLAAEEAGKNRTTLVAWLEARLAE